MQQTLERYLDKNPNLVQGLFNPRSAVYKQTVKEVRSRLRRGYGVFRKERKSPLLSHLVESYLKSPLLKKSERLNNILSAHSSTKERLDFYPKLYGQLWEMSGKPLKILDLGCGINPFSIPLMGLSSMEYYAYDLSNVEVELLNKFFTLLQKKSKIRGLAQAADITQEKSFPKVEVVFLFKMTDILDQGRGHKKSEQLIKSLDCKWVVVSFPTLTMSGQRMNYPRRRWIELMVKRLGYEYKLLEFPNEIFYTIRKK